MQSDLPETEGQGTGCGPGYHHGELELYLTVQCILLTVLYVARTVVPAGHDDGRGESRHQEAGDVLQPAAEGGLPPKSDGEGNTYAFSVHDQI